VLDTVSVGVAMDNVIIRAPWPNSSYAQPHTQAIHPTIYLAALGRTGKA